MTAISRRLRNFALVSLAGATTLVVLLAIYFHWLSVRELERLGVDQHKVLARTLSGTLDHHVSPLLRAVAGLTRDELRRSSEVLHLRHHLAESLKEMRVVRIKIYNPDGLTVFSTDPSQIGEKHGHNPGFVAAMGGSTAGKLIYRDTFNSTDGVIENRNLLETYISMPTLDNGAPKGVFELYSDVTPLLHQIDRTRNHVVIGAIAISLTVFSVLFFIYKKTDAALEREQAESMHYLGEIERAREMLEERVEERTQRLAESEQRFRDVIDSVIDALIVSDANGKIEMLNPAAETLFGYAAHELHGKSINVLMPEIYRSEHDDHVARYVKTGHAQIIGQVGREVEGMRKDGTVFPLELSVGELRHKEERKFVGVMRDLTVRKDTEQELEATRQQSFHSEKMAAVGQLAAGIIHEVGNPVAAISGAIDSIRRQQASSPGATAAVTDADAESVDIIASQINRLADLTREISEFAAPPTPERRLLDLNQLVRSGVNLLRFDPRWRDIMVQLSLDHNIPAIHGSADQLTQVLFNLLMNAADACENLPDRKPSIDVSTFPENGQVCMTVADNGCGMDDDVEAHAFDPFFSTKAPGKGIGLGLGLCRNLIEEHGGNCDIETRAGAGTTIQVCLPVDGGAEESVS